MIDRLWGTAGHEPDALQATLRGFLGRCPRCGDGRMFQRFLKVAPQCSACGQDLSHHRADDFPPYIVMFVVCHVVGYGIYIAETHYENVPLWLHVVLWPSLAVGLCLALLQPVKGAVVGLQYGLRMHGFGGMPTAHSGTEDVYVGERAGRTAEAVLRDRGPGAALAEPAAEGRRYADRGRPKG